MAALLPITRMNGPDWTVPNSLEWFMYGFASMKITEVSEWNVAWCNQEHHGKALRGTVYWKAVPR